MKNNCISPIVLKNGTIVPCGKCEICRSNLRLEWQYRLRIHLMSCAHMPMFVTLTYSDEFLPMGMHGKSYLWKRKEWPSWRTGHDDEVYDTPCLCRRDASVFIRQYKRKYGLKNEFFQYFGCGERGDLFGRPHFHFIFFGDDDLYNAYMFDTLVAQKRISAVWDMGHVHVGVAGYDGIAYVTKYVLKNSDDEYPGECNHLTIASHGLGMNFLNTQKCKIIRRTLDYLTIHQDVIYSQMPELDLRCKSSIENCIDYLRKYIPDFTVVLDDGTKVFIPRAIRKKITGTFEHFKDNPLWLWNHLNQLKDSFEYYENNGYYDALHEKSYAWEQSYQRIMKINQNNAINKYNKQLKRKMYETV